MVEDGWEDTSWTLFQGEITSSATFLLGIRTCFGRVICFNNHLLYWIIHVAGHIVFKSLIKILLAGYWLNWNVDSTNLWQKNGYLTLKLVSWQRSQKDAKYMLFMIFWYILMRYWSFLCFSILYSFAVFGPSFIPPWAPQTF